MQSEQAFSDFPKLFPEWLQIRLNSIRNARIILYKERPLRQGAERREKNGHAREHVDPSVLRGHPRNVPQTRSLGR
jgi:hypothetical protein